MRNSISGGATAFAIALALAGCSGGSSSDSSVSIDGSDVEGAFATTCAKDGNNVGLAIADETNETYGKFSAAATLSADGSTVLAVTIAGSKGGSNGTPYTLGFGEAGGVGTGGSAEVSVDGTTYTVKGEGLVTDVGGMQGMDPMDMGGHSMTEEKPFEIVFACEKVVE